MTNVRAMVENQECGMPPLYDVPPPSSPRGCEELSHARRAIEFERDGGSPELDKFHVGILLHGLGASAEQASDGFRGLTLHANGVGSGPQNRPRGRNVAVFSTRVWANTLEIRPIPSAYALPPTGRQRGTDVERVPQMRASHGDCPEPRR